MKRLVFLLIVLGILFTALPASAITTGELFDNPEFWDGRSIVVTGELVGDYGVRGNGVWVQLNDDPYSQYPLLEGGVLLGTNSGISVLIPTELFDAESWGPVGRYRTRGPLVSVTAVFHYNSPLRQGATFLEAEHVTLVEPSRPMVDEAPTWPLTFGLVLLGSAIMLWLGIRLTRRRRIVG